MAWRKSKPDYEAGKGAENRTALQALVKRGPPPGVLALADGQAIGWCSIAPRAQFVRLSTARTLKPIDDQPVWSITCLFVQRGYRRQGVSVALVDGAVELARKLGAQIIEAYPSVVRKPRVPDVFIWTGVPAIYERAGFQVARKAGAARWIMRKT